MKYNSYSMYNPYTRLTPAILTALLQQPMYFVRQYYPRGLANEENKIIPLLLTHYTRQETERANRHMRLLYNDPFRFLYDSTLASHAEKLKIAASPPPGYRVYINLLPKKWKAADELKLKINRYIKENLGGWNDTPGDNLKVTLKERYGQLYIALLWKGHQTEVLLDNIEYSGLCVTT